MNNQGTSKTWRAPVKRHNIRVSDETMARFTALCNHLQFTHEQGVKFLLDIEANTAQKGPEWESEQ